MQHAIRFYNLAQDNVIPVKLVHLESTQNVLRKC